MTICQDIQQLIECSLSAKLIEKEDEIYARNQILSLLHIDFFTEKKHVKCELDIPDLLMKIVTYACDQGVIEDRETEKEKLSSKIMNCFIPMPSIVNQRFYELYKYSPKDATQYFYTLSTNSNYIQGKQIQKNISYKARTEYGELDITINLSKPEKDPNEIIREDKNTSVDYPKCLLCIENEGYAGRIGHPARSNHRMIQMNLLDERWYLQYSPYVYYLEHCIVLSKEHRNMKIDRRTFSNLLSFVARFPHYFLGSNADLPIVGGSILSHDHYQGGQYEFAMAKAEDEYKFELTRFPDVQCSTIKWPVSVIRLRSKMMNPLVDAADFILRQWNQYSDPSVAVCAYTNNIPHNTITPIARKRNKMFELNLVLRNNRTNEQYPLGIFHPHQDVQHIKKENIGLIEVMGLAVLPARLKKELQEIEQYLIGKGTYIESYHVPWVKQLIEQYKDRVNERNVRDIVRKEIANKFLRALENASVFKRNDEGILAFRRFIQKLQLEMGVKI
ncbi:UDP-glucose--hexose-1-phosphate uridylyltransferase [Bacillus gaemokensis]|uniref:Galactose-1-phosphate uridylyltransferase n=1 Tax=Bacillus gaemokensis TaxID=574375 RepID=A0A073KKW9_9BACI|nr:UDP-glucose--hexose-1-phosphate uridylyltransferase [Bacillus gaemokensis]KEK22948.1 galactose-1-phosphate uridylyltransferase [Bacillus gaemokensis]KYG37496.1 galactose-1-phosphate uridylyltransferase [Bacillus gaemokensis]